MKSACRQEKSVSIVSVTAILRWIVCYLLFAQCIFAQSPSIPGNWSLTFDDEFNSSNTYLDGTKWRVGGHYAGIAGVGGNDPANVSISSGVATLKSQVRSYSFSATTYSYAASEISTFKNFRQQYGYFEARIKYAGVTGLWPAFWLMPDRASYGTLDYYRQSYIKFDLSSAGLTSVTSAKLKLTVSGIQTSGNNNVLIMKVRDDSWAESTLTWNNKPTADPAWIAQLYNQITTTSQQITVDVTAFVNEKLAGNQKVSFALTDTFMRDQLVKFYSREASTVGYRPQLIIDGTTYYAAEDTYAQAGSYANTAHGSETELQIKDSYGDTASTYNNGMETDIMESLGIWGTEATQHTLHWDGYGTDHQSVTSDAFAFPSTSDGYHTYGVYWQQGVMEFYVDGVKTWSWINSRVCSVPCYLLLSLQLGGWDDNNPGSQVDNQTMQVDWVRVWSGTRSSSSTVIVDNATSSAISSTGTWTTSTATSGYYGSNYVHDGNTSKGSKSFTFTPTLGADDDYLVYARWTTDTNRAANVPIDVYDSQKNVWTTTVSQQTKGAQWNLLGGYSLSTVNAKATIRTTSTSGYVVADAVKFVPGAGDSSAIIVDNASTTVSYSGTWSSSTSTSGYYSTNYLHDGNTDKGNKTFSFKPTLTTSGDYLVYAWWTEGSNRATNVPIDIITSDGTTKTVAVNQQSDGGRWVLLGGFPLSTSNAEIKIRTTNTTGYVIADAVKVVPASTQ
jgi:beta-glucanase (GH16 family)